jgi:hypothetical protein
MPKDDSCDSRLRFRFSEQVSARWQNAPAFSGRQLGRKVAALGAEDFGLRVWEAVPRLVQGRDSAFAVNLGVNVLITISAILTEKMAKKWRF